MSVDAVAIASADLRGGVELVDDAASPDRLFSGWVTKAEPADGRVRIECRSGPWLDEGVLRGWTVRAHADEQFWSLARIAGVPGGRINMSPPASWSVEGFAIVVPLDGVMASDDVIVGDVGFTSRQAEIERMLDFASEEDRTEFLNADAWAVLAVESARLFDAEYIGLQLIEAALDRITLDWHYASIGLPDGRARPYSRSLTLTAPARRPVAAVTSRSGRAWLRSLRGMRYDSQAPRPRETALRLPSPLRNIEFELALGAWRRALTTRDTVTASVALWEALEFYVAGIQVPPTFEPALIDDVVARASAADLTKAQSQRVIDVLRQFLNQPPVTARFRAALELSGIPFTDAEMTVMSKVRRPRTEAQHGKRPWKGLAEEDLELARGFVARVLAYWGHALSETPR